MTRYPAGALLGALAHKAYHDGTKSFTHTQSANNSRQLHHVFVSSQRPKPCWLLCPSFSVQGAWAIPFRHHFAANHITSGACLVRSCHHERQPVSIALRCCWCSASGCATAHAATCCCCRLRRGSNIQNGFRRIQESGECVCFLQQATAAATSSFSERHSQRAHTISKRTHVL